MLEEIREESQNWARNKTISYLNKNQVDMKHTTVAIKTQWMN